MRTAETVLQEIQGVTGLIESPDYMLVEVATNPSAETPILQARYIPASVASGAELNKDPDSTYMRTMERPSDEGSRIPMVSLRCKLCPDGEGHIERKSDGDDASRAQVYGTQEELDQYLAMTRQNRIITSGWLHDGLQLAREQLPWGRLGTRPASQERFELRKVIEPIPPRENRVGAGTRLVAMRFFEVSAHRSRTRIERLAELTSLYNSGKLDCWKNLEP